ncbi:exopolysaccharide biosynthesis protein [Meridianimarinicoccus sp. RP-17]|uniref:exopolysaccharide biosynthesis protein n=1 Tax=Meridianimarinicoccus zhengii TaxID=2056810 RepID=UPI000DAD2854|nr:exopolysaccharide biosynthesis protein [Phycocomes zhengii]
MTKRQEHDGSPPADGPRPRGPQALPGAVDRLRALGARERDINLGDLVDAFGAQGHAPLLMIVSILMIVPVGMIPGVGGALGLLAAAIGVQMIAGRDGIWMPRSARQRSVSAARVTAIADKVYPFSVFLARFLEARWQWLAAGRVSVVAIGFLVTLAGLSLLVIGVIPVLVPLMGLPVAVFAMGLMAEDGAVVAGGYGLLIAISAGTFLF